MYDAHRESERAIAEYMRMHHSYTGAPPEIPCPEGDVADDVVEFRDSGAVQPGPLLDAMDAFEARRERAFVAKYGVMSIRPHREFPPMESDPW